MCALFRYRLNLYQAELLPAWSAVHSHALPAWAPAVRTPALLAATSRLLPFEQTGVTLRQAPLGETQATVKVATLSPPPVVGQAVETALSASRGPAVELGFAMQTHGHSVPPLGVSGGAIADFELKCTVRAPHMVPRFHIRRGLEAMREQPVERRGVPAQLLSDEQTAYWRQRMGDAKRVTPRLIDLVAIFPDVPLKGDSPVRYSQNAITYTLPEEPVPLTTVVIAKHHTTGQLMVGRFGRT